MSITKPELELQYQDWEKSNGPLSKFGKEFYLFLTVLFSWYDFPNLHILLLMVLSF